MSNWRHSLNLMSLLLLLAISVTAGYLYYQWQNPTRHMSTESQQTVEENRPQSGKGKVQTGKFEAVSISVYGEITERPLFVEGRLPPPEPEKMTSIVRTPIKPLRLKLEGVAMMPDNKVAIIRDLDTNELLRVSQGMKKNDWKVESVDSESATVSRKGERLVLKLEMDETRGNRHSTPGRKLHFRPPTR